VHKLRSDIFIGIQEIVGGICPPKLFCLFGPGGGRGTRGVH